MEEVNIFWFRRDLRIEDNAALHFASNSNAKLLPIFIFDKNIISELKSNDPRINFIYDLLCSINKYFNQTGGALQLFSGNPVEIFKILSSQYRISGLYFNKDYEPYAIDRDNKISQQLQKKGTKINSYKDQVIFEQSEITKNDSKPYTVFTPYKNKWLSQLEQDLLYPLDHYKNPLFNYFFNPSVNFAQGIKEYKFPSFKELGFEKSNIKVLDYNLDIVPDYENTRNLPYIDGTSNLSPHLRFGSVSIRHLIRELKNYKSFVSELIWREFFMQILYHYPNVVQSNFKAKYDNIQWRNNEDEFCKWKDGHTGYPLVDAGMRQLNQTGYMHNRVRMVVASFLCKHLLIDWRWGEAYFAQKLLDYELSSNNGNWQWAAGTGCDAAPYFRVFNPHEQLKKFDPKLVYTKIWVKDFDQLTYAKEIVEHKYARERALSVYKKGLSSI